MNLHEHQAKEILRRRGLLIPDGGVAFSSSEARSVAEGLGGDVWAVKAQIHAGGRGKAGGVKIARNVDEVERFADEILGMTLITPQTGPQGKVVRRLYVERGAKFERELYLSMLVDRKLGRPTFVASTEGGMDIEAVAAETPDKIAILPIDPASGAMPYVGRRLASSLGLTGSSASAIASLADPLYRAFVEEDMSLLEINPLALGEDGLPLLLDAKVSLDDNASFRHADWESLRDVSEEDEKESRASAHDLSYVALEGSIGCMVNGAGLAMATMDAITLHGGSPANFLDVGGGADRSRIAEGFRILLSDSNVKAILVNVFAGIMRCDEVAEGLVSAAREVSLSSPLVARLEGNRSSEGKAILASSGLAIESAENLDEAALKAVAAANRGV